MFVPSSAFLTVLKSGSSHPVGSIGTLLINAAIEAGGIMGILVVLVKGWMVGAVRIVLGGCVAGGGVG